MFGTYEWKCRVEEALAQLMFVVPACPLPHFPEIEEKYPKEQMSLHARLVLEAGVLQCVAA